MHAGPPVPGARTGAHPPPLVPGRDSSRQAPTEGPPARAAPAAAASPRSQPKETPWRTLSRPRAWSSVSGRPPPGRGRPGRPPGTVLGALGPNGAGKTTAIRILATLLRPNAGHAAVGGLDVVRHAPQVRRLIGLTGQYASVDEDLTGEENLTLIGELLDLRGAEAKARAAELLDRFGLTEAAGRRASTYSGGMRRRLDLAASLVGNPRVIFLDEPTTGLDPGKREDVWRMIRLLTADGGTVLLTTQYLKEADALADEIAVIHHGTVIAHGTAAELKEIVGGQTIVARPKDTG